jgi:uncharacterized protein (TIGR03084 family)
MSTGTGMDPICDDLAAETADLLKLLIPLPSTSWDSDTPAAGWTIRDQVSHLAFFDETGNLAATDKEAFIVSAKELQANPHGIDIATEKGRTMASAAVLSWFMTVRAQMIASFRELDPKARLPWYGPPMGALSFATARLMETWAHGQDVADALGQQREPTDRLRHIAHIGVRARPFSYATNKLAPPEGEIHVKLRGPGGDYWTWNDPGTSDPSSNAASVNSVTGDALEFCLVVTQRRHIADTSLQVSGPLAREWIGIAQAFAGAPGTGRQPGQFS